MKCNKCGFDITKGASFCTNCGNKVEVENIDNTNQVQNNDTGSFGWSILGFFLPLVGLILFLCWKDSKPKSSKHAGIGALVGAIVWFIFSLIISMFVSYFINIAKDFVEDNMNEKSFDKYVNEFKDIIGDVKDNTESIIEKDMDDNTNDNSSNSVSKQNALKRAKEYLDFSAFSFKGLVKQLESEGFSNEDATYAADSCGADWNEQAVKKAKQYLKNSAFSHKRLVEQLEFDGFTHEQAEYGVTENGL